VCFLTASFYGEELSGLGSTPKLGDHSLLAVRDHLFSIFAATLHIGDCSLPLQNWCSETHTLSKGLNDILPHFLPFCLIWIKFNTGSVHKKIFGVSVSFMKIDPVEVIFYLVA